MHPARTGRFHGVCLQVAPNDPAENKRLVDVPGLRRVRVALFVEEGQQAHRFRLQTGFLPHFLHRHLKGRVAHVGPAPR